MNTQQISDMQKYSAVEDYYRSFQNIKEDDLAADIGKLIFELQALLSGQEEIIGQLKMRNYCLEEEMKQLYSNDIFVSSSEKKNQQFNQMNNQTQKSLVTCEPLDQNTFHQSLRSNEQFVSSQSLIRSSSADVSFTEIPQQSLSNFTKPKDDQIIHQKRKSYNLSHQNNHNGSMVSAFSPQNGSNIQSPQIVSVETDKSPKIIQMNPLHRKSSGNSFSKESFQDIIPQSPNKQMNVSSQPIKNVGSSQSTIPTISVITRSQNEEVTRKKVISPMREKKGKLEVQELNDDNAEISFTTQFSSKKSSTNKHKEELKQYKLPMAEVNHVQEKEIKSFSAPNSSVVSPKLKIPQHQHEKNKKVKLVNKNDVEIDKVPEPAPVISVETSNQGPLPSVFSLPLTPKKKTKKVTGNKGKGDDGK